MHVLLSRSTPAPPIGMMDTSATWRSQGDGNPPRYGNETTDSRAPAAASTAAGPSGLVSGSSGLVRWDLGVEDHI